MHEALKRSNVSGMRAMCDGGDPETRAYEKPYDFYSFGPMCDSCKVEIKSEWNSKIPKSSDEDDIISQHPNSVSSNTRLACCIQVEKWMDGMFVKVGHNE